MWSSSDLNYSLLPVNGNKLRCWKQGFVDKSVGGCTFYDVLAPWPSIIRQKITKKLRKRCSMSYKISARSTQWFVGRSRKLMDDPLPPDRARVNVWNILIMRGCGFLNNIVNDLLVFLILSAHHTFMTGCGFLMCFPRTIVRKRPRSVFWQPLTSVELLNVTPSY